MTLKADLVIKKMIEELEVSFDNPELPAILSHWLQNPEGPVALMTKSMERKAKLILSELWKASDTATSDQIKEGQPKKIKEKLDWEMFHYPPPNKWNLTFIDLFAGLGGFRQAFQNLGAKCIFSSEWDKYAKKTYQVNYGETPFGDIRLIPINDIPYHDILCAGFPCQPFSLAGVSKKNALGQSHGFQDKTQGTLFFEIKEIIRQKRPKVFFLENVKNLLSHDNYNTFGVIKKTLEDELGYIVKWSVVDGANWVPQHRERVFIVGYNPEKVKITDKEVIIILQSPPPCYKKPELSEIIHNNSEGFTLGPGTWATLERHKKYHFSKGHGFGYTLHKFPIKRGAVTRTISARYHKDGAEILIDQKDQRPRFLSVEEAMQLQGFDPKRFEFPVSRTQSFKQIGNSVVIPAISATAGEIVKFLMANQK